MAGGYPDLISPAVPDAQANRSPYILLEGLKTGLAAAAHFAEIKRQSDLEVMKIAAQERIAQDEHAVQREKIYKDSTYQDSMLKSHAMYYDAMGQAATTRAEAYARGVAGLADQGQEKAQFIQDFKDRASELKLNDPKFERDDPAQFYLNAKELSNQYGTSTIPDVQKGIRAYRIQSEQHKIQLPQVSYDEAGQPTVVGKVWPNVVVGQVVDGLHDPTTHKLWYDRLELGGHITPGVKGKEIKHWFRKNEVIPETPPMPDATAQGLLNKSEEGDFGGAAPVIQPDLSKKTRDFRAIPQPTEAPPVTDPEASASPASSTPETDSILQAAQMAVQKGASLAAVLARLRDDYGIDVSQLAT